MEKFLVWLFCLPMTAAVMASFEAARYYASVGQTDGAIVWSILCAGFVGCWLFAAVSPFLQTK